MGEAAERDGRAVVLVGATGAVGTWAARALARAPATRLTTLSRRPPEPLGPGVASIVVDPLDPFAVRPHLAGHTDAVCALGLGQPSKAPRSEFLRVDRDGVLAFAAACREAGVTRFALLSSVGADARSPSWYLRAKGELEDGLRGLGFASLRLVRPSVILTPAARFGALDAALQAFVPWMDPLLPGPLRRYRGVRAERLGEALARPFSGAGEEIWHWDEIHER